MRLSNDSLRYGAISMLFHWIIVVLVIVQFLLANKEHHMPLGPAKIAVLAQHKSIGITILLLALLRLVWRFFGAVPADPPRAPRWQSLLAHGTHYLFYALLFAIPLSGWLMSSARSFSVSWFGLITLPDLIGPNKGAYSFLHEAHEFLGNVLLYVAILHALAALKHHFIDRDNVLRRMLPIKLRDETK
ncbi:MAG TPA: cytochrome b [Steroidobacteraceae bacterium]|nr:cytochrome b [Steroidobacteraceae bacterium]